MGKNVLREQAFQAIEVLKQYTINDILNFKDQLIAKRQVKEKDLQQAAEKAMTRLQQMGFNAGDFSGGYVFKMLSKFAGKPEDGKKANNTIRKMATGESNLVSKAKQRNFASELAAHENEIQDLLSKFVSFSDLNVDDLILYNLVLKDLNTLAVLKEIEEAVETVKEESNKLPIGQFQKIISEKLKKEPAEFLFEKMGTRYQYFFIDEFQDTSVLQWTNILPLINNSLAEKGSAMLVGDPKQSIFRFRGGEADLFINMVNGNDKSNKVLAGKKELELYKREAFLLQENYRSHRNIVDFNNELFALSAKEMSHPDFSEIYKASNQNKTSKEAGYVRMCRFVKDKEANALEVEVQEVLNTIQDGLERNYQLKDMVILMRNLTSAEPLMRVLMGEGIPVISEKGLLLSSSAEVQTLVAFLKVLAGPNTPILRLPFLEYLYKQKPGCTEEEEFVFLRKYCNMPFEEWQQWLENILPNYNYKKIAQSSLTRKLYVVSISLGMDLHKNIFLTEFLDQVTDFELQNGNDLTEFLRFYEDKMLTKSVQIPEGISAVRLMTIHKSKGLEFPFVLVPKAAWNFSPFGEYFWYSTEELGCDISLPVLVKAKELESSYNVYNFSSLNYIHKSEFDSLNLLYVACTRAVEELHIIYTESRSSASKAEGLLNNTQRFLDTIYFRKEGEDVKEWGVKLIKELGVEESAVEEPKSYCLGVPWEPVRVTGDVPVHWAQGEKEALKRGKWMHKVLADIYTIDDVGTAYESAEKTFNGNTEEMELLRDTLEKVVTHSELSRFFAPGLQVINEQEILLPQGQIRVPDRVVLEGNKTHVIDYKTGVPDKKYRLQVDNYQGLLRQMGYESGDSVLVYLDEDMLVEKW